MISAFLLPGVRNLAVGVLLGTAVVSATCGNTASASRSLTPGEAKSLFGGDQYLNEQCMYSSVCSITRNCLDNDASHCSAAAFGQMPVSGNTYICSADCGGCSNTCDEDETMHECVTTTSCDWNEMMMECNPGAAEDPGGGYERPTSCSDD
jgi:hypothetical protein